MLAWRTETRTPALAAASATSTRLGQASRSRAGARPSGSLKKLICATCMVAASQAHDARIPLTNDLAGQPQLPGVLVAPVAVAPRCERPERGLPPGRCANVHHRRESAPEHGREVDDASAQACRQPRRILVAPVCDPLGLSPLVRTRGEDDRAPGSIAQPVR